ncbi:MAG TPA: lytic murein transglycosylase [Hyphomicrobiales bacterium]|nr:lytic murein transglycosylase [Hyphomicrobiales bacterium]
MIPFDQSVIGKDRAQKVFSQTFLEFSDRMVADYRLKQGAQLLKKYGGTFARIEDEFGVPGEVVTAFWAIETDFGANIGDMQTLRSLATLAYDCRRPEMFHEQLIDALKIIDRGDLRPEEMRGPWAGELGQLQFLPSHYLDYGVDYDGDGRRNLLKSSPDALASAANYLSKLGWRRGEPWLEEVKAPAGLDWAEADLTVEHPRSQWAAWGVTRADGKPIAADGMKASLLLPMGKDGPAFLAYPNFRVYFEWNQSLVYSTTAAYLATRYTGAGKVRRGNGAESLAFAEIKELQQRLQDRGFDVGGVDGFIGEKTRAAVKAVQKEAGMAPDSWPTPALLARLRAGK